MTTDSERLSPLVIRRLNKALARVGLRVCRSHQGHPLPLDTQHFYRASKAGYFDTECIACKVQRATRRGAERYQTDAAYRALRVRQAGVDRWRHIEARRASERRKGARYRLRRKAAQFARVLAQVTP